MPPLCAGLAWTYRQHWGQEAAAEEADTCSSGSALHIDAPLTHKALIGSTTLLPCTFTVDSPPIKPQFLAILWLYGEKELAQYNSKGCHAIPGTSISEQEVRRGNASLTIHNVTISNQGTYKCLVIYTPNKEEKEIQLNVQAPPLVSLVKRFLLKNKNNLLTCLISNFYPMDIRVTWLLNDQQLDGGELGNFQIDANGKYRVNSSITISSLQNQDHPTIVCQVEHVTLQDSIRDVYTAQYGAEPKVRLFSSRDDGEEIFVCEIKEFYPDGVEIYWFLDGKRMGPSTMNGGAYNKWDHFRIPGNKKRPKNISCMVEHETMGGPLVKTLTVSDEEEPRTSSLAVAVPLTIFITLCVILASLAFLIFKKKYFQRFQLSTIHNIGDWSNNSDGKVTMCCTATNCPQEIQVTWTVTETGGKRVTISDQSDGEKGPLMDDNYKVRTDQSQTGGLHNAITSLNFTPDVSKHRDMKATCSFHCGRKTKEQHGAWSFNTVKPRLPASMKMALGDSGDVLCSVTLEKFYPRKIKIKWSCGVGNYQELETLNERFHPNPGNTFTCESECRVSGRLFQDQGFKVRVMWEHQSMNQPEIQEMSAEHLPWRPVMGDITIPSLIHGQEASFRCVIRSYFPENLEVTWLRREAEKPELYAVSPGDKYKIPVMEVTQQPDKTFTSTATLVVSVSAITEDGSEFVCRVSHPSLKKYLEKVTGGLTVKGKPVIRKALQDGGGIILEVDSFYTPDLVVTWERADKEDGPYKKNEEDNISNKMTQSEDGSYTLTCTCDVMRKRDLANPSDIYFKLKLQHEALKSPEETFFLRQKKKFYTISKLGLKELEQIEKKSVKRSASSKHSESKASSPSSEHTMRPADAPDQQ